MIKLSDNWIIFEGRKTGRIYNRTYFTDRIPAKHFYVLGQGYPISEEILNWLDDHDITEVEIIEKGKRATKRFRGTVKGYLKGQFIHHPPFDKQRNVPLNQLEEMT